MDGMIVRQVLCNILRADPLPVQAVGLSNTSTQHSLVGTDSSAKLEMDGPVGLGSKVTKVYGSPRAWDDRPYLSPMRRRCGYPHGYAIHTCCSQS